jgi:adenine-specific DNA-methyltransferase
VAKPKSIFKAKHGQNINSTGGAELTSESAESYKHSQPAVQRPDVGVQEQFTKRKPPKTYRYDSSLDPSLSWDENRDRELAEWLLGLIDQAAEKGEKAVFGLPQEWEGGAVRVQSIRAAVGILKRLTKPFLNWAGKAERHQISVPTVPLFVHERHSTKAILEGIRHRKAKGTTLELFGDAKMEIGERLDAYEHEGPWQNRMILGDSLQIMNSMLEFEGLGGQVQMVYMDPPYGVKFGSNFQPFVRNRTVGDSTDADLTREPEMVKAYRDTWELGLHSYLTYLRDRLTLARELLHESGSVFVQISEDNLHHVRELLDEIYGSSNFVVVIVVKKTGSQRGRLIQSVNDYLLWYARDRTACEAYCKKLYEPLSLSDQIDEGFDLVELPDGKEFKLSTFVKNDETLGDAAMRLLREHPSARLFAANPLTSGGYRKNQSKTFTYRGRVFDPGISRGNCWKHTVTTDDGSTPGMQRLADAGRLYISKNQLRYKRYTTDFAFKEITNWWDGLGGASNPIYVVQTNPEIVKRCMLLATQPGDLVLDPTCGSGTTAYVAEYWGRRWITIDTSRVPLALTRQRILTATYPYFELKEPNRGPAGGFRYEPKLIGDRQSAGGLQPHITSSTIANGESPATETMVDRPNRAKSVTRVSGPFVVEATIAPAQSLEYPSKDEGISTAGDDDPATHIERMTQILRQSKTLRLPENQSIALEGIRRLGDVEYLHAEAFQPDGKQRIAVVFGPEDGAISSDLVYNAASEAFFLKYAKLFFFGFAIQAKARELLEDRKKLRIPCFYIAVTPDVAMSDLLKTSRSSEIFSVTGLPDFEMKLTGKKNESGNPMFQATLAGLDIFDPSTLKQESIDGQTVPAWMLDTDYDGLSFHANQVFFPKTSAWDNLQKSLKATFDDSVWAHLAGTTSEPFVLGDRRRVAVKVIDERGNELMRVRELKKDGSWA